MASSGGGSSVDQVCVGSDDDSEVGSNNTGTPEGANSDEDGDEEEMEEDAEEESKT